ncbi:TPA: DEAD/DEAH box helicase [Staphylococcus aureus]|nr:DEAD/DEAH box helicase [Staphylococcus aureus]HDH4246563.1 DEAD/DEAH box helicase [Staphylococcus aureus]HDH4519877.1 DEAD/DEAH box helicase [Staphylococcus aureus]HDH4618009.1 DEAD/DEAH box helicase [Staphylococcus aureus]
MVNINFYENISDDIKYSEEYLKVRKVLIDMAKGIDGTIYILQHPLYNVEGENSIDFNIADTGAFVILIPNHKIIFASINDIKDEKFEEYVGAFIDSITTLVGLFKFKSKIGNSRKWLHLIEDNFDINNISFDAINKKKVEENFKYILDLLISLITGSINTPDKGGKAENILEAVKKRIIQFDADQTRFVYDDLNKNSIYIQGLAGTGKTELLFHRLVNLYTQTDSSIVFTCYSRILVSDIQERIPKFFDQMRVSERSDINERIKVMRSWGSLNDSNSGLYSYICNYYGLEFINYASSGRDEFDGVCKKALSEISKIENFKPCFDYILVDEAQDFTDSFFELCELVSSKQVIIASDIFQKIYDRQSESTRQPDFTLNKVYRTDPKNFMFSQFLGFGIKEKPIINWLSDEAWKITGYTVKKIMVNDKESYEFSRNPINRFKDFEAELEPTKLIYCEDNYKILHNIKDIIDKLRCDFPNITPEDIGIVFISQNRKGYNLANMISSMIEREYDWETQKIYESKYKNRQRDKVFISNQNNVKGLEFSFLIGIVLDKITDNIDIRNTLYMMMTRSFLTSYLLLDNLNNVIVEKYGPLLNEIIINDKAVIEKPDSHDVLKDEELERLVNGALTFEQKIERALNNMNMYSSDNADKVEKLVYLLKGRNSIQISDIEEIIKNNKGHLN